MELCEEVGVGEGGVGGGGGDKSGNKGKTNGSILHCGILFNKVPCIDGFTVSVLGYLRTLL